MRPNCTIDIGDLKRFRFSLFWAGKNRRYQRKVHLLSRYMFNTLYRSRKTHNHPPNSIRIYVKLAHSKIYFPMWWHYIRLENSKHRFANDQLSFAQVLLTEFRTADFGAHYILTTIVITTDQTVSPASSIGTT